MQDYNIMDADTIQKKLFEQPFTVIILVGILVFQNQVNDKRVSRLHLKEDAIHTEYEKTVSEDRDLLLTRSQSLVEAIKAANESKDQEKDKLYNELLQTQKALFEKLIECEKSKNE